MKFLLLEDDDLLAESLAESLKDNGYRVDPATSLRVARSVMRTENYALAILDLGLQDMTRRFWIGLVLALPVLMLEMGGHLFRLDHLIVSHRSAVSHGRR
ncbi:response regulator [Halomonas jincaotanensis]|uniref:hypothetical protein n=1 Tax=Halomonas jincaotanensis TaxID=2810616 RepID=UPI002022E0DE|nr:hypothetical protein [Halomonas jincaotanensis]